MKKIGLSVKKIKLFPIKNNVICVFIIGIVVTFCFCVYVYHEKKQLISVNLESYDDATKEIEYKINKIDNNDSDINIYASINKENNDITNTYISLEDKETGSVFIVNTEYDQMMISNANLQKVNLKQVNLIARLKKDMLIDGHTYNVYIILKDKNNKNYIKSSEVVKC